MISLSIRLESSIRISYLVTKPDKHLYCFSCCPSAIQNPQFLSALFDERVDQNCDGLISIAEARSVASLNLKEYTSLTHLYVPVNQLTDIDVSKNIMLTHLDCSRNEIVNLDISKNIALKRLDCGSNQIISLDVTNNTEMERLWCYECQLSSLVFSDI